jgi:hypothetical protein
LFRSVRKRGQSLSADWIVRCCFNRF